MSISGSETCFIYFREIVLFLFLRSRARGINRIVLNLVSLGLNMWYVKKRLKIIEILESLFVVDVMISNYIRQDLIDSLLLLES